MQVFIKQSKIKNDHIALKKSNGWNFKYATWPCPFAHAFLPPHQAPCTEMGWE